MRGLAVLRGCSSQLRPRPCSITPSRVRWPTDSTVRRNVRRISAQHSKQANLVDDGAWPTNKSAVHAAAQLQVAVEQRRYGIRPVGTWLVEDVNSLVSPRLSVLSPKLSFSTGLRRAYRSISICAARRIRVATPFNGGIPGNSRACPSVRREPSVLADGYEVHIWFSEI